ncbi:hypothetical protein Desgi_3679 [Desulfoscipio gibsoniae DSM 7213]|uniref:Uncharacterized protein n=1 Tax=Desulfoscipio gibsoniae DSM 7213 TaxID=767817 RepID=R4KTU0_9FIRM|nr:hypothetical protein Desgi_3679 [Desulfoscipio gibsoniae DSM 7213]
MMALSNEKGQDRENGPKKIVIGKLAVDPIFLLIFLFFTACSLLLFFILWLAG